MVQRCHHEVTGQQVAVKAMSRSILRRLNRSLEPCRALGTKAAEREIAVLKKLRHDNIVPLIEVIDDRRSGFIYLVLELQKGAICTTRPNFRPLDDDVARRMPVRCLASIESG